MSFKISGNKRRLDTEQKNPAHEQARVKSQSISSRAGTKEHGFRNLPTSLDEAITQIYMSAGLEVTNVIAEKNPKSFPYDAARLTINGIKAVYRAGKTTPSRPGQFVTLWKRPAGTNVPLEPKDVDVVIVNVDSNTDKGQFIFHQEILMKHGYLNAGRKKGKMAFRVFPPGAKPKPAALKTQQWQCKYFLPITSKGLFNKKLLRKLLHLAY